VRVFRQKFTLDDAIQSYACSLEANMRVTNGIPLGCPLFLPFHTVNCVQTLKDYTMHSPAMVDRQNRIVPIQTSENMLVWNFGEHAAPYINTSDVPSFKKVIHMSQVAQTDCVRAETEHYRRGRQTVHATGGATYWMLNDNWPAVSWTSLEYGTVRVFGRNLHSRMPLDPTHVRLKLFHACDQWHSSRKFTLLLVGTVNCVQTLKEAD
jgi:hypothetical protein